MRYIRYIRYKMRVYHMYRDTKKIHFSGGRKKKTCITIHVYFMILVIQNTMYHDTQKMKKNSKIARRYMKIQVIQAVSPYLVRIYPEYWYQTMVIPLGGGVPRPPTANRLKGFYEINNEKFEDFFSTQ